MLEGISLCSMGWIESVRKTKLKWKEEKSYSTLKFLVDYKMFSELELVYVCLRSHKNMKEVLSPSGFKHLAPYLPAFHSPQQQ